MRDVLRVALMERFADQRPRTDPPPGPVAIFPAKHSAIGDIRVREMGASGSFIVSVEIGDIIASTFESYDSHLESPDLEPTQLARARQLAAEYRENLSEP